MRTAMPRNFRGRAISSKAAPTSPMQGAATCLLDRRDLEVRQGEAAAGFRRHGRRMAVPCGEIAARGTSRGDAVRAASPTCVEFADRLALLGGVCAAGRRGSMSWRKNAIPWVGSHGALDMVKFWAPDSTSRPASSGLQYAV